MRTPDDLRRIDDALLRFWEKWVLTFAYALVVALTAYCVWLATR